MTLDDKVLSQCLFMTKMMADNIYALLQSIVDTPCVFVHCSFYLLINFLLLHISVSAHACYSPLVANAPPGARKSSETMQTMTSCIKFQRKFCDYKTMVGTVVGSSNVSKNVSFLYWRLQFHPNEIVKM